MQAAKEAIRSAKEENAKLLTAGPTTGAGEGEVRVNDKFQTF